MKANFAAREDEQLVCVTSHASASSRLFFFAVRQVFSQALDANAAIAGADDDAGNEQGFFILWHPAGPEPLHNLETSKSRPPYVSGAAVAEPT